MVTKFCMDLFEDRAKEIIKHAAKASHTWQSPPPGWLPRPSSVIGGIAKPKQADCLPSKALQSSRGPRGRNLSPIGRRSRSHKRSTICPTSMLLKWLVRKRSLSVFCMQMPSLLALPKQKINWRRGTWSSEACKAPTGEERLRKFPDNLQIELEELDGGEGDVGSSRETLIGINLPGTKRNVCQTQRVRDVN